MRALRRIATPASVAVALTAPLMLIAALAIVLESPGPVLYWQKRVGRNGIPFRMPRNCMRL